MKGTYQPYILELVESVFEALSEDIKPLEESKEYLCKHLTQRLIDGKLDDMNWGGVGVFDSDEEFDKFLTQCLVNQDLEILHERGLIGTFDDGESFFLTEEGKLYVKQMMKTD